jgi:hypothetical protein
MMENRINLLDSKRLKMGTGFVRNKERDRWI